MQYYLKAYIQLKPCREICRAFLMPKRRSLCHISAYPNCQKLTNGRYCEEHQKLIARQYNRFTRSVDVNKKYGREWKRIRDRYVQAHPLCEQCLKEGRTTPTEEVHHIIPLSKGGTHSTDNLMSLCQSCHNKIHHDLGDR